MIIEYLVKYWNKLRAQNSISETFNECKIADLPLLAIDLELTGLDTDIAKVTSIGWIAGHMCNVQLNQAHYKVVRAKGDLLQSPVFHKLCAKQIQGGQHIKEQIILLDKFTDSHVWVFHNANLDIEVLNKLWKVLGYPVTTVTTIDSMLLQVYVMEKKHGLVPSDSVTLSNSRKFYDLKPAPEHNALDDALATLTLFYAQMHYLDKHGTLSIKQLAHTRAFNAFTLGA